MVILLNDPNDPELDPVYSSVQPRFEPVVDELLEDADRGVRELGMNNTVEAILDGGPFAEPGDAAFENPLKGWLARRALRGCDALTGDSTDILQRSVQLGADPQRAFRVLWGVDFEAFRPVDPDRWRRAKGFTEDQILFFSPRSYTQPYYNIDTVIQAAAVVAERDERARFLFAGYEGDPGPFRDKAVQAGLEPVMRFLGRLSHDDFARALQASAVLSAW